VFVRLDSEERQVVDSEPYQRLRHIHQLAMTYLVYPGATHRRFEHCLGVMEVATRIFDVVTNPRNIYNESVRDLLPESGRVVYWRTALRMAALCHDMGHLPFSHGPEDLLPKGTNHETLSSQRSHEAALGANEATGGGRRQTRRWRKRLRRTPVELGEHSRGNHRWRRIRSGPH